MATGRTFAAVGRRMAIVAAVLLIVTLAGPPSPARAAVGPVNTTAQTVRVSIGLLSGAVPLNLVTPQATWTTGGATNTQSTLAQTLGIPITGPTLATVGATTATAQSATGGGQASSQTAGLNLLSNTAGADALGSSCLMTPSAITTTVTAANLKVGGQTVANPTTTPNQTVGVTGVLTGTVNYQTAAYNATTGRLDHTVRALDLALLGGLSVVASGSVVVGESTCSGIVKLGTVTTSGKTITPGLSDTPTVTVTNTGDIAAPNTVIKVPAPPTGYTPGTATTTGGGTCANSASFITCSGVTVPGAGSVTVSLPVTISPSATSAANWAPGAGTITAVSTPIAAVTGTTISASGAGTLVTPGPPVSTGGSVTVAQMAVAAGKNNTTTVTVGNSGPSDAPGTAVTIPIGNAPTGVSVVSADVGGTPCTVTSSTITCGGLTVPASGTKAINVKAAATTVTPVGTAWDLAGISTHLNGTAVGGSGRLLQVSDPDVNLTNGITITGKTATPGGSAVTPTIAVHNVGIIPATGTSITWPAAPTGYTVGAVTTTGGGTCTATGCTGVTVPANGTTTVSIPVTLAPAVTAAWSGQVTATSGSESGQGSGTLVTASPSWTLGITSSGPAARTVRPGQSTSYTVNVTDQGPSDAVNAAFVLVAPQFTTWGTPPSGCVTLTSTTMRCTLSKAVGAAATVLTPPLTVAANADPNTPLTGGCVSLDNNSTCDSGEPALPAIQLQTPLANRLTVSTTQAAVVPGTYGNGQIRLTSTQNETGLTVTVPLGALPTGFSATGTGCTVASGNLTCTGVDLTAGQQKSLPIRVAVASSVVPPQTWTATGVTVSDGSEQISANGALASADTPAHVLTATVTGPPDNTLVPGDSTSLKVTATNQGPSDYPGATFTVTAPNSTTFGAQTAPCALSSPAVVQCTVNLAAGANTGQLSLPLTVSPSADPFTPLTGGCVDLDGAAGCGGDDVTVPPIVLRVPFDRQVSMATTAAAVTPGATATATVGVTATHGAQSNLTVTVPLTGLPAGVTVTGVTAGSGPACSIANGAATCTGVNVPSGGTTSVNLAVSATPAAASGGTWTANGITVGNGGEQISANAQLATVGAASYALQVNVTPPAQPIEPGGSGTLGVDITNNGPSNATNVTAGVNAPAGVTFGTPGSPCTLASPTRATCTFTLASGASLPRITIPITVDSGADPGHPITGGCVDVNNDGACGNAPDVRLPDIPLATPLSGRLTIGTNAVTVVPGASGTGQVTLRSTADESGLSLTVPLGALPAGFTASSTACTAGSGALVCPGISLSAGVETDIPIRVTVASSVVPPRTWAVTGITVTDSGGKQATGSGTLATAGSPSTGLTATLTGPADYTVPPGGATSLTLAVGNAGPSDAPGATITVAAPSGSTFGTLSAPCTATSATVARCTVDLTANSGTSILLPLNVNANADPFTPLTGGCADLDGAAGCGSGDAALAPLRLKVPLDRRAAITTTMAQVAPGTEDTATVGVTASHGALHNLTVTVPTGAVPAGLTVVPATPGCTATTGRIDCTGVEVADGSTTMITLRVAATPAAAPGTDWTATGITVSDGGEQITADARLATVSAASYVLRTTVTGPPAAVEPGGHSTFGVEIDNQGPSNAANVTIGIIPPADITLDSASAPCTRDSATHATCTFSLTAAAAPLPFTFPFTVDPGVGTSAPISGGCVDLDNDGVCGSGDAQLADIPLATPFDREVSVSTRPVTVTPGDSGTAAVVITTTNAQSGLTVVVPLSGRPDEVTVGTPTIDTTGSCTRAASQIRCTGVARTSAGDITISIPVSMAAAAPAATTWTVAGVTVTNAGGEDASGGGQLVTAGTPAYNLTATVTGPADDTVLPGGTATVTATIADSGPSDATNVPVTVHAPVGTSFGTPLPAGCTAQSAQVLACTVTVSAGGSLGWSIPVDVPSGANPAQALTGGCLDLNGDGACGGARDVPLPDIRLRAPLAAVVTLSADNPSITPGTSATATVTIGASATRNGMTVDLDTGTLPAGLTLTGASCPVTGGVVHCTGVNVAAGGTRTITLTLAASAAAPAATWTPSFTVRQGTETATKSTAVATVGAPSRSLSVTIAGPADGTVYPGGTGDLAVTVRNAGPSDFPNAQVAFKAPAGTTFAAPGAPCTLADSTHITCTMNLGVESRSFTLRFQVPANANPAQPVTGGCADVNADGACGGAGDVAIGPYQLGTPLDAAVTLSTTAATVTPGESGTGRVVAASDRDLGGLTLAVPTAGLPGGFTVTGVAGPTGSTCDTTDPARIVCRNVAVRTGNTDVARITVRTAANTAQGTTWRPGGITLTDSGGRNASTGGDLIVAGAPSNNVSYIVAVPQLRAEPGEVIPATVTASNPGPSDTPIYYSVVAPSQMYFPPLPAATDADCDLVGTGTGATRVDCRSTVPSGGHIDYSVPMRAIDSPDPAVGYPGGCVDRNGNYICEPAYDTMFPRMEYRALLGDAIMLGSTNPAITPGAGGTTTIQVSSTDTRDGMTVRIPTTGRPAGLTIGSVTYRNTACTAETGAYRCLVNTTASTPADLIVGVSVAADAPAATWAPMLQISQGDASVTAPVTALTIGPARAPLVVRATGPADGSVLPGGTAAYAVTVSNSGPSDATGSRLVFHAPTGTTWATPAAAGCVLDTDPSRAICTVSLTTTADLRFTLRAQVPGSAQPGSTLTGGCASAVTGTACGAGDTTLPNVVLGYPLDSRVDLDTEPVTITPGLSGTFRVTVDADATLSGLTVTIPMGEVPDGFRVTGATDATGQACEVTATAITCRNVTMTAGPNTFSVVVATTSALRAGVTWTAYGIAVRSPDGQSVLTNGQIATTGPPVAPVTARVAGPTGTVQAGGTASMMVTLDNPGPSDAIDDTATVIPPSQTTFGALDGRVRDECAYSTTLLTCTFDQTANGDAIVWNVPLVVDPGAAAGSQVSGGCVSLNGDTDCADPVDVSGPIFSVGRPFSQTGNIAFTPATVAPGDSGDATISISATSDFAGVGLTVPLSTLPDGFSVTAAAVDDSPCPVSASVSCPDIALTADTPVDVTLTVEVDSSVTGDTTWTATGVTVVNNADSTDRRTATGPIASTSAAAYAVTVSAGTPTVTRPAARQTSVLPLTLSNAGPSDASPYELVVVLPDGLGAGTLPEGCAPADSGRVIECSVTITAGASTSLRLPVVVDTGTAAGTVLRPCVDGDGDRACGAGDQALYGLTVSASKVDLRIRHKNPRPKAVKGGTVRIGLPYRNSGNTSASGVTFTIDPPAGVTVVKADILPDASTSGTLSAVSAAAAGPSPSETVPAACLPDPDGDANGVVCTGPDEPVGASSELWLTLRIAKNAKAGTYPLTVTVSATSPEGDVVNNTAIAQLTIAGADDVPAAAPVTTPGVPNDNSDYMPVTGADVIGMLVLSSLLVAAGITARVLAHDRPSRRRTAP